MSKTNNMPSGIYKRTEEYKKLLRVPHKGSGIYQHKKGYKLTEEQKKNILKKSKIFRKGCIPWNKDKKLPQFSGKNHPMFGKHHTEKSKEKIRQKNIGLNTGKKHWNWQGGLTSISKQIRNSLEYKLWRIAVFTRDNFTCLWCGAKNGNGKTIVLHADHIKPFAQFPELRFAIDNGRTLCLSCHQKTNNYGRPKKQL